MLRNVNNIDILTFTLLGCLAIMALAKLLFTKRFNDFLLYLITPRYTSLYLREKRFFDLFEGLIFLNFVINIGVFIHLYLIHIGYTTQQLDLYKYAFIIGLFLFSKVIIEKMLSKFLDMENIISKYVLQKISFRNFLGLLLFPVNIVLIYMVTSGKIVFTSFISIIALAYILGIFLFAKYNLKTLKKSLFYFILYLCTLEIAPYIVLYKIMTTE